MRTPGDDLDLALGFLLTEGVIRDAEDVVTAQLCAGTDTPNTYNVVDVVLAEGVPPPDTDPTRTFYTTSSCGVCGKASIDAIRTRSRYAVDGDPVTVGAGMLAALPERLRAAQRAFDRTGGLHAAGLFTAEGEPAGGPRGRRPAQRGRQGGRVGGPRAAVAADRPCAAGLRPRQLRADPEGVDGRYPGAGRGVGAAARSRSTWPRRPA